MPSSPTATPTGAPASVAPSAAPVSATGTATPTVTSVPAVPDLVAARGADPVASTRAAVDNLGGMGRFVKRGQRVLVKPNICIAAPPEQAATTNPDVVGTLVKMCLEAGAASVLVLDYPFASFDAAYDASGIAQAVAAAGGSMEKISDYKFREVRLPDGEDLHSIGIYEEVLKADVLIDVPIAKHHGIAQLTIGMKNLMGVVNNRATFHANFKKRLPDLLTAVRPTLTVVDAVRILTNGGPTGGDPNDVQRLDMVIATADIVAADAYASTLFGKKPDYLAYVAHAAERGLGVADLGRLQVAEVRV